MTKYHVVPGINGTRRRDSVTVCIKDWKYLIWSHGMYNNCINCINLGVNWQIICKYNLRICILYKKCPPGYTGVDCAYRCHYPSYGEDCFMTCECSPETCDFVSGCEVTRTTG